MNVPRIRGRVGRGDDTKWYFELSLWNFEGTVMQGNEPLGTFGPFNSKKLAFQEMNRAVEIACKGVSNGEATGYVDFKNGGEFRPFKSGEQ